MEDALGAGAPTQDAAGPVDRDDAVEHGVEDRLELGAADLGVALGRLGMLAGVDQLGLGVLALGDVAQDGGEEHLVAVAHFADAELDRELAAVLAHRDQFAADARTEIVEIARPRGHQNGKFGADDLVRRVAEDALGAGAPLLDPAISADRDDRVGHRIEDRLKPRAADFGLLL